MSSFKKGTYVTTVGAGSGRLVQGYGSISYVRGEELIVTSITSTGVNVKKSNGGRVFRVAFNAIENPARAVGEVPAGGIAADDPRIAWIFEDAQRLADRLGLCRDFDRIAEAVGVPGRVRVYTVKLGVGEGLEITAKVEARSRPQAQQMILERFSAGSTPTVKAITA